MLKTTGTEAGAVTQMHQRNAPQPEPGRACRAERTVWPETKEAGRSDEARAWGPGGDREGRAPWNRGREGTEGRAVRRTREFNSSLASETDCP